MDLIKINKPLSPSGLTTPLFEGKKERTWFFPSRSDDFQETVGFSWYLDDFRHVREHFLGSLICRRGFFETEAIKISSRARPDHSKSTSIGTSEMWTQGVLKMRMIWIVCWPKYMGDSENHVCIKVCVKVFWKWGPKMTQISSKPGSCTDRPLHWSWVTWWQSPKEFFCDLHSMIQYVFRKDIVTIDIYRFALAMKNCILKTKITIETGIPLGNIGWTWKKIDESKSSPSLKMSAPRPPLWWFGEKDKKGLLQEINAFVA